MTSKKKGYPFEVKIENEKIQGVILSDRIKNLDWRKRDAQFISKATDKEIDEIVGKFSVLLNK